MFGNASSNLFGSQPSSGFGSASTGGFSFGTATSSTTSGGFSFGVKPPTTSAFSLGGIPAKTTAGAFGAFGVPATTPAFSFQAASQPGSIFGSTTTTALPKPGSIFSFQPAQTTQPFQLGSSLGESYEKLFYFQSVLSNLNIHPFIGSYPTCNPGSSAGPAVVSRRVLRFSFATNGFWG